jgi:hypothetical protein
MLLGTNAGFSTKQKGSSAESVGRKHRGHGVLEETANDFAPLRDATGETSWFLYGSEGFSQMDY